MASIFAYCVKFIFLSFIDTRCNLKDPQGVTDNRELENSILSVQLDDYIYIYILTFQKHVVRLPIKL